MKKIIILLTIMTQLIFASTQIINAKYKVSYSKFLPLGVANATMKIDGDNYEISIEARATGLARVLSQNRVETYKSIGKIVDGEFIPEKFIKIRSNDKKNRVRTYTFNNKDKTVDVLDESKKIEIKHNANLEPVEELVEKVETRKLDYYSSQDILSLFFNLKTFLKGFDKDKSHELKAVGANKTKGVISVLIPSKRIKELKTKHSNHLIAYINQKIFGSAKGELLLSLNNEGFCNKAILKDVLLFGDIVGEMVEFNIKG